MTEALRRTASAGLWLLIFAACLELGLRAAPQAIPLSVLTRFDPAIRSEIAARRNLARAEDTTLVARGDGGPPGRMWFFEPGTLVTSHFDEEGVTRQVAMDMNGLCNSPADLYQAARFDVLALGDSFTWCTAVAAEEAWPARLQALTGLSTYNAGMSGRGLYEYVQILEHFGLPKRPRVVVMAVYEGNDLRDAHRFHRARAAGDEQAQPQVCAFEWEWACGLHGALDTTPLRRWSYAYNLLSGGVHVASYALRKSEIDFRYAVSFADGKTLEFNSDNADRDEVQYARWLSDGQLGPELFDEALEAFMARARQHHFVPVVVYLPSAYTAFESQSRFEDPAVESLLRAYSSALRHYFERKAEELGYRYVDTVPAIQQMSQQLPSERRLYFRSNVHLTQQGHELVARLVAEDLQQLAVVPALDPIP